MNFKALVAIAAMLAATSISAAEIKVIASNGVKEALHELAPSFERETGHKLVISFGLATALKRQIEAGETFDLPLPPPPPIPHPPQQGQNRPASPPPLPPPGRGNRNTKNAP